MSEKEVLKSLPANGRHVDIIPDASTPLYHGTSFEGLAGIFRQDAMAGSDSNAVYGASLTTDPAVARRFAKERSAERAKDVQWNVDLDPDVLSVYDAAEVAQWVIDPVSGGGGGVIMFDRERLQGRFAMQAIDEIGDESEREMRILGDPKGVDSCLQKYGQMWTQSL